MFSTYDKTVQDIICGKHRDMCCLMPILPKVQRWLSTFGYAGTLELLELACACAVQTPAPTPPPQEKPKEVKPTVEVVYVPPPTLPAACSTVIPAKGLTK
jgi:hypothetical protein